MEADLRTGNDIALSSLLELYTAVGWAAYTRDNHKEDLEKAVANSSFVVTAWDGELLVGLARALSDDVAICYVQDILVHPDYQRRGIGMTLMHQCLARYRHVRMKMLLTDDEDRQRLFYEKMGFQHIRNLTSTTLSTFVQIDGVD